MKDNWNSKVMYVSMRLNSKERWKNTQPKKMERHFIENMVYPNVTWMVIPISKDKFQMNICKNNTTVIIWGNLVNMVSWNATWVIVSNTKEKSWLSRYTRKTTVTMLQIEFIFVWSVTEILGYHEARKHMRFGSKVGTFMLMLRYMKLMLKLKHYQNLGSED